MKTLLILLTGLKFGKVLLTAGTMLLSMGAYAFIFGWRYAVGFVLLIFCHEMGHYLAAKQRGLAVGAPTFIPFVGAWIQMKEQPVDVETEAYVGIAGPVVGTLAAAGCYYAADSSQSLMMALAYAGFMINLFNLIPLSPLDGGRITAIISPKVWWLGVPILIGLFIWNQSPMLLLVAVMAIPHLMSTFRGNQAGALPDKYYDVPLGTRVEYALYYFALAGFLGVMSYNSHRALPS
jgi:Zn-dependent protease